MYVTFINYVNWHRENLQSDREKTENLKIQFEWVPCLETETVCVCTLTITPRYRNNAGARGGGGPVDRSCFGSS